MKKLAATLITGIALGAIATYFLSPQPLVAPTSPRAVTRDIADVTQMTPALAKQHREERYVNLATIDELLALPTPFARMEALHVLAGRSDSASIQQLIFDANRIADDTERNQLLRVLFSRLAEMDPHSALALARTEPFDAVRTIEQSVWSAWARLDLDAALFAAKTETSLTNQNRAAQSLFAAFGYMGNETTERIEAELDIEPDRSSRARYLYRLADQSPTDAIRFINEEDSEYSRNQLVSWLANYFSLSDPHIALTYENLFEDSADARRYSYVVKSAMARQNPRLTIERWLSGERDSRSGGAVRNAIRKLASTDIDAVRVYFEQARSSRDRQLFGGVIAAELAKRNPLEALEWARANERSDMVSLETVALQEIARHDPQFAFDEALGSTAATRSNVLASVLQQIAHDSPAQAIAYLDDIENEQQKLMASQYVVSSWVAREPDAAIAWVMSQTGDNAGQVAFAVANRVLRSDIDAAIRLLPKIDDGNRNSMQQQIALHLATNRSAQEAESFIRRFEREPGYAQLQASVISGVAQADIGLARQMAAQLPDGTARDTAQAQIVSQRAMTDPLEASRWLQNIADERLRASAASQVAANWYAQDAASAIRWVDSLPAGEVRDNTIFGLIGRWNNPGSEQERLIGTIDDPDKRGQAKGRLVYHYMRSDPARARELLKDEDIPDPLRRQIETHMLQQSIRY